MKYLFSKLPIVFCAFFLFANVQIQAQFYSTFWNAKALFNPAASGISDTIHAVLIYESDFIGFSNNPKTKVAEFDMKIQVLHGGINGNYRHDKGGNLYKINQIELGYSYHFNFTKLQILSLGLSGKIRNSKINNENVDYNTIYFSNTPSNQIDIPSDHFNNYYLNVGLLYKGKNAEIGLSTVNDDNGLIFANKLKNDYILNIAYNIPIGNKWDLKPDLLYKSDKFVKNTTYYGLQLNYNKRIWSGLTYNSNDRFGIMAGYDFAGMVRAGYSIEFPTSNNNLFISNEFILVLML